MPEMPVDWMKFCQKFTGRPLNRLANEPMMTTGSILMQPCEMDCR